MKFTLSWLREHLDTLDPLDKIVHDTDRDYFMAPEDAQKVVDEIRAIAGTRCDGSPVSARPSTTTRRRSAMRDSRTIPIEPACWRRSASQTARRFTSVIFAPSPVRCQIPNSTSVTTSGGNPRRLTRPPSETAGSVSCQCRSSAPGQAGTACRHRT